MNKFLRHLLDKIMSYLGLGPSDKELELDRICDEENQKVYRQLEFDLEAISKGDEGKESI